MRLSIDEMLRRSFAGDPLAHDRDGVSAMALQESEQTLIATGPDWQPERQPAKHGLCVRK